MQPRASKNVDRTQLAIIRRRCLHVGVFLLPIQLRAVQRQSAIPPSSLHRNSSIISQNNVAVHHDDERRRSGGAKIALQSFWPAVAFYVAEINQTDFLSLHQTIAGLSSGFRTRVLQNRGCSLVRRKKKFFRFFYTVRYVLNKTFSKTISNIRVKLSYLLANF